MSQLLKTLFQDEYQMKHSKVSQGVKSQTEEDKVHIKRIFKQISGLRKGHFQILNCHESCF